jgi:AraC-like DNA-binding protein
VITIQTYRPEKLLTWIKCFWYLKVPNDFAQPYVEEIIPDGHHEIVFHLNTTALRKRNDAEWLRDPQVYFSGQNRTSYAQRLEPGAVIYGIRFYPHTQHLLYNFPATLTTDGQVPLEDVSSDRILATCVDESSSRTFMNFERQLLKKVSRLNSTTDTFHYVDAAVRKINELNGNLKIESLEKLTGVSTRHLEKSFQRFVGLTPKQFSTIIRFGHFVNFRKRNPEKTLTECALETNFYDQAHLTNLSRNITGRTPKSYFHKVNHINDFFLNP